MSQAEYHEWARFYSIFPFDDFHRFHRPAALISQSIGGGDIQARLNWLQPEPGTFGLNDADIETMKAFGFKRKGK